MNPICFFDIESTGVDVFKDRIVSLAITRFESLLEVIDGGTGVEWGRLFNPGIPIPKEATECHGIEDWMVEHLSGFSGSANEVHAILKGCDLGGFNVLGFDISMLWEEFHRAGIEWNLGGCNVIDAGNIFKKKEERTLSAAVKFYCNREHSNAHDAHGDVAATVDVFRGQLSRYRDLMEMDATRLGEFSLFERRFDLAGKIALNDAGEPVYNFGKSKGVRVADDPSFAWWMLGRDFPTQTKQVLEKYLNEMAGHLI
jgi:DNA polymerase-3 subunit epsilon